MSGRRKSVRISEAEWRIMNVLWAQCPDENSPGSTLGEIVKELQEETDWSSTTIRTLLIRLADKGVVEVDRRSGVYKYMPKAQKSQCVQEELDSFVARVFDNSSYQLMASLVRGGNFSERERRKIIDILNEIE